MTDLNSKPEFDAPEGPAPTDLVVTDIVEGDGDVAESGSTVKVHYGRRRVRDRRGFDSSWNRGEPIDFPLAALVRGWQEGIPGMKVGGAASRSSSAGARLRPGRRRPLPVRQDPDLRHRPARRPLMAGVPEVPTLELNDGHRIPALGLGTYSLDGDAGVAAVGAAIASGYRLLDTALNYGNEDAVGRAVRESDVPRDAFVVTSKLPGRHHGYDEAHRSVDETLANLGLDHLDLYLIHWPNPSVDRFVETWKAFVDLRDSGKVRSIGVSNFTPEHLDRILDATGSPPR